MVDINQYPSFAHAVANKSLNSSLINVNLYSNQNFGAIRLFDPTTPMGDLGEGIGQIVQTAQEINHAVLAVKAIMLAFSKIQDALRNAQVKVNQDFHTDFNFTFGTGLVEISTADVLSQLTKNNANVTKIQTVLADAEVGIFAIIAQIAEVAAIISQCSTIGGLISTVSGIFPTALDWVEELVSDSLSNTSLNFDHFKDVFDILTGLYAEISPQALAIKYNLNYLDFIGDKYFNHTNEDSIANNESQAPSSVAGSASGSGSGSGSHGPSILVDGPDGFLWKPDSASNGKLVILLPESSSGHADVYRAVLNEDGKTYHRGELLDSGNHTGYFGPNRAIYRFTKPGSSFGKDPVIVAGKSGEWLITKPEMRND